MADGNGGRARGTRCAIIAGVALALLVVVPRPAVPARPDDGVTDPLVRRSLDDLERFVTWLDRADARGYIGEVGWPADRDAAAWNALAAAWYRRAGDAGLEVTYWATGEWWGDGYPLSSHVAARPGGPLDRSRPQAAVITAQAWGRLRGVTVNGGEFGDVPQTQPTSAFSNRRPGTYERDWHYDRAASFAFLAGQGVTTVKVPFRWERVQPRPGGALDEREVARIARVVARAHGVGLEVILDLHNYGGYYVADGRRGVRRTVGSAELPDELFADVWRRLSARFAGMPGVRAYGLMSEPADMPPVAGVPPAQVWERSSQAALDAIRASGDDTLVMVSGYGWSKVAGWTRRHPRPWIRDPVDNVRYEAHHYWDRDGAGDYARPYGAEVAAARALAGRGGP